ncbi:aminotransferase class IV [Flavobacterium sp. F-328]|uniref:branched-chain-amino-acid transaminase n=1 Tax=Flavobacterium erciyesense TaxID=2825842 RepID=A0ABS5D123_9FLAO|nr:aminotransferase class IV [Flavobacterium erciyesense]MBQ0907716.1 aminotransferase class IV [Flavobacterium erciyesense]
MINFNGTLLPQDNTELTQNRGLLYGDAVFETLKISNGKILFLEDHYFRLMAAMRVIRMDIPMNFTMEFLEEQVLSVVKEQNILASARARITVYRNDGGFYLPTTNTISYLIHAAPLENATYVFQNSVYEVDLFKDFYIAKQLLSSIKTTNRLVNITGSIFASENGLDNCLLLNDTKNVVEALQGNLFMLVGSKLTTPPLTEGCLNGIMRKQIFQLAKKIDGLEVVEEVISPFDLQKADELFLTNVIQGIRPITQYRKKKFTTQISEQLNGKLNELIANV